ncbi:DUF6194 family protein [Micromonospora fluostatini]|uniref:DUF6194 family protein n=1 Tax=Micromonospora sp. JCM 30529 TaxID=3421643 RepID=UPI003D16A83C
MEISEISRYVGDTFAGVRAVEAAGDTFFLYDPDGDLPPQRQQPFATIVTTDRYDSASRLDAPGRYRLNVGLTRAGYTGLFGPVPTRREATGLPATGHDATVPDRIVPHPVYAGQHWVCVVNPDATWPTVRDLLAEAYGFAVRRHANHRARGERQPR